MREAECETEEDVTADDEGDDDEGVEEHEQRHEGADVKEGLSFEWGVRVGG